MPLLERAGSKSARTLTYQCPRCSFTHEQPIGRPGDRTYADTLRVSCPRCPANAPDPGDMVDSVAFVSYMPK